MDQTDVEEDTLDQQIREAAEAYMEEVDREQHLIQYGESQHMERIEFLERERRFNESQMRFGDDRDYPARSPVRRRYVVEVEPESDIPSQMEQEYRRGSAAAFQRYLHSQQYNETNLAGSPSRLPSLARRREASIRQQPKRPRKTMLDFEDRIPKIWLEDLLDEQYDNSVSVALMETCGPITLFVYNRCMELSAKYVEMKDLRSLFLTAAACSAQYKRSKPSNQS